jgi:hypothetical protein
MNNASEAGVAERAYKSGCWGRVGLCYLIENTK